MPSDNDQKIKTAIFAIFSILAIFLAISCKECPTEPDYDIYLSVVDVLCTSITLRVTLPDSGSINTFALDRDDSTIATFTCYDDDTLITDENLTPDTDYTYSVRFMKDGKTKSESDPVSVHTMPTTSHDLFWEVYTLSKYESRIREAWIVDENNIWVVGNIETDSGEFNAAHWNGSTWELIGIYSSTLDLSSIYYFSEDDIWVTDYCSPIHWDGENWTLYHIQNLGLDACAGNAIWGTSSSNMYFVGSEGSIVHYDGSTFRKMDSGTDIVLTDIWGVNENTLFATGSRYAGLESVVLKYDGDNWQTLFEWRYPDIIKDHFFRFSSVWTLKKDYIYLTGDGTWKYFYRDSTAVSLETGCTYISTHIRGTAENDIFVCSSGSEISHFNGLSWYKYDNVFNSVDSFKFCSFSSVAVTEKIVVCVGMIDFYNRSSGVVVVIGRR